MKYEARYVKKLFVIDPNQWKHPTDGTLWPKNDWWTDRKGSYEVTFDMLENEMLGGIKLKIKLES